MTTDWFQTVNAVAEINAADAAPRRRNSSSSEKKASTRWMTRNQKAAATAPFAAENRLILTAVGTGNGESSSSHVRASSTNTGLPGGCGIPRMCAVAMYSLVSQNAVVGASVMT